MRRGRRWILWVGGIVAVALLVGYGTRFVPFFEIRRVEVIGLRYLDPAAVLDSMQIPLQRNLFEDLGGLQRRAGELPGVARVEIHRRLPGTLQLIIRERSPVALLADSSGMLVLGARGDTLPFDPVVSALSLPVVVVADTMVLRVLSLVKAMDSSLFAMVDDAQRIHGAVVLSSGGRWVRLLPGSGQSDFVAIQAVRRDLAGRAESFVGIDASFDGWVVVRREGV